MIDRRRWLAPAAVAAYVVFNTWSQPVGTTTIPYPLAFAALAAVLYVAAAVVGRRPPDAISLAAILVGSASLVSDIGYLRTGFTDLGIYLRAGQNLLDGQPVYQLEPLQSMPADYTTLPYLYPPPATAFFAVLAALPGTLGGILFIAGSIGLLLLGARCVGLSWPWSLAVLAWPPVFVGIMSGNVSVGLFGLFALGPLFGTGLLLAPLFKPYNAIASLWLLRERRFRSFAIGVGVVAVICVITLPFVGGIAAWLDWLSAISTFAQSERQVRQLYGISLGRYYVPTAVALAVGLAVTLVALRSRGGPLLARLGIATIVAQPTLYLHGFIVALPSLLELRSGWLWVAAATLSVTGLRILPRGLEWPGPWLAVGIVLLSWALPALRRSEPAATESRDADDATHPLGDVPRPWPIAIDGASPTPASPPAPAAVS